MAGPNAENRSLNSGSGPNADLASGLLAQLADGRQRIVRTVWALGLGRLIAVLVGSVLLCGFVDWLLHVDDAGIRVVLSLAIIVASGWVVWKYLGQPLRSNLTNVDVARQVERCNPGLNDRLSSSVQFLSQSADPGIGSPELQQTVVEQTVRNLQHLDTANIVDARPAKLSMLMGATVVIIALLVTLLSPGNAVTAVKRLAMPLADHPWPKQTILQFVDEQGGPINLDTRKPWQLAEGQSLELLLENTVGDLPEDARIQIQVGKQTKLYVRSIRPSTVTDEDGQRHDVGVASLSLLNSLRFRAIGGDDEGTAWQSVQVIPVPVLNDLKVSVQPPAYTELPAEQQTGSSQVSVLNGSEISISAKSSKRLQKAMLIVGDQPPVPLSVTQKKQISASFVLDTPGPLSWHVELTDTDGFTAENPRHYEINVQADQVPDVYIDRPAQDLQVTVTAAVEITVVAKDDIGVKDVRLQFRTGLSEDSEVQTIVLKQTDERPEQASVEYIWNLTDMNVSVGDRIVFHAEATDDFDLGEPHVGRSVPRTLIVVSAADKQLELANRQTELMAELERIADLQTRTHDQTRELQVQLEQAGELRDDDVDLLKRVEVEQRRITSRLFEDSEGLESQAQRLLNEIDANQLEESDSRQQIERLGGELKRIREHMTPEIENQLTRARKSAHVDNGKDQAGKDPDPADDASKSSQQTQDALTAAAQKQQQVIDSLKQSLDELSNWKQRFDIVGDLNRVISEQEQLNQDTTETSKTTLTKSVNQLTPQQKADLARLAERQRRQAREMRDVTDALGKAAQQLDGALRESVKRTAEELNQQSPDSQMEAAADRIAANQLGGATQQQSEILNQLNQARQTLNNQSVDDSETMVKKLKQREAELNELRDRQQEMIKQLQDQSTEPNSDGLEKLQRQQQQLRAQTEATAEELRRDLARQAARSSDRAAEQMRQAEQSLQQQSDRPGESNMDAAEEFANEALQDLEQALDETAEQRQRAESELAQEAMLQLADALTGLVTQQKSVVEETVRLEGLRQTSGRLTRSQSKTVLNLADVQRQIQGEVDQLSGSVSDALVVAFALSSAANELQRAAERLSKRDTGVTTVALERAGLKRLDNLLSVLQQEQQSNNGGDPTSPQDSQDGQAEPESGQPQDTISLIAQLTLLRSMQQDLFDRTANLERQRLAANELNKQELAEVEFIANEQNELANLAEALVESMAADGTEQAEDFDEIDTRESEPDEIVIDEDLLPELELER